MESEFPGNSRRQALPEQTKDESKKVEPVVTGEVVRRKKSVGKRFLETFLGDSARNVARHVLMDVLLPAAKDTIADAVSEGVERLIFGETRSAGRRRGFRPGSTSSGQNGYVSYNRMSSGGSGPLPARREEPRQMSRQARSDHDFDEILLASRVEAETVIERMFDLIERYGQVTVGELYSLVGITAEYTDEKWGWTDIRGAKIVRIGNHGYLLDLPKTEPIR